MNNRGLKQLVLFFLLFLSAFASQAGVIDDLKKISSVYSSFESFGMNLTYSAYAEEEDRIPKSVQQGSFMHCSKGDYLQVGEMETYVTTSFKILVDKTSKLLAVFSPDKKPISPLNFDITVDLCDKIDVLDLKENCKGYKFIFKEKIDDEIRSITIVFNRDSYLIQKAIIQYKNTGMKIDGLTQQPRLEVSYFNYNTRPSVPQNFFSLERFITGKADAMKPSMEFKGFTTIDSRNQ